MARRSARANLRSIRVRRNAKSRIVRVKSGAIRRSRATRRLGRRVRIVRSRATGARRIVRPLPAADPLSERVFIASLERSLRDHRVQWEALAKR